MKINSLQVEIDGIDKEILRDLMDDARKPILQIANKIGISGAAIHQRLRKLITKCLGTTLWPSLGFILIKQPEIRKR